MFGIFRSKGFWTIIITSLILILVISLSSSNNPQINGLQTYIRESFAPLQNGVDTMQQGLAQIGINLFGLNSIQDQLEEERSKNDQLSLENMQLRENKAEVERLRTLLGYQLARQDQYVLEAARVIARSPNNWYRTLTINKGADCGIAVDMPVINAVGLVGKIINVSSDSAQVLLITDREMAVGAILQETRENRGIVEGIGNNGELRMINIPYYSSVADGEQVVTSGLSQTYPAGIQIGTIKDIQKEANGLVLSAAVAPFVDFDRLEEVLVITSFNKPVQEE